jgi:hypothetical protein
LNIRRRLRIPASQVGHRLRVLTLNVGHSLGILASDFRLNFRIHHGGTRIGALLNRHRLLLLRHRLSLLLNQLTKLLDGLTKHLQLLRVSLDLRPARRIGGQALEMILNVLTDALKEEDNLLRITTLLERCGSFVRSRKMRVDVDDVILRVRDDRHVALAKR